MPPLPENALLCTIDVVGLYPSIPHDEGLQALKRAMDEREDKSVSTESLIVPAQLVLKNNYFEYSSRIFRQNKGTAIGTKFAPPYAILFMAAFEEDALKKYHFQPWLWWRYIDDIFLIWEHGREELEKFITYLNSLSDSIKFTSKISSTSIEFLDVNVTIQGGGLSTDLFVKETDTHQLLHYTSCHPFHTKKGIPYSQALRFRRICSTEEQFDARCDELRGWLNERGYDQQLVNSQIERAKAVDRNDALNPRPKQNGGRDFLVLTYHPALGRKIYDILKKSQDILLVDDEHRRVFNSLPLVSFRRCKTLQDSLVRAKLRQENLEPNICRGCNRSNCLVCDVLVNSDTFYNNEGNREFKLRKGVLSCSTDHVIYCLTCKTCNKKYVGSTTTPFRRRYNNYKSHFKTYKWEVANKKKISVPQAGLFAHFLQEGHNETKDWSFQLIDRCVGREKLLQRESFWQYRLGTFLPAGLNDREVPT